MQTRKLAVGKYGLKENPVNRHVTMPWKGRMLLGEIRDAYRNEVTGMHHLRVRHFCGDAWPVDPQVFAVDVIG